MPTLQVRLPDDLHEKLKLESGRRGVTASEFTRRALDDVLSGIMQPRIQKSPQSPTLTVPVAWGKPKRPYGSMLKKK